MANMTPTNLLQGIAKVTNRLNQPEFRMPSTAAVSTAYIGDLLDTPMTGLRTREDRTTYFDWMVAKADESKTERLYNHSGNRMDSQRTQITWGSVVDTFSISEKQLDNNMFTYEEVFAKGVLNAVRNNLSKFDIAFLALILADKTQVNNADFGVRGSFNTTDDVFELAAAEKDYWPQMIENVLNDNDYREELIVLADSLAHIDMMRAMNQGAGNDTNLFWQYGNSKIVKTSRSLLSGYNGSALAVPANMVGLFPWVPKQNRKAIDVEKSLTYNGDKGSINVPIFDSKGNVVYNIDAAVSIYSARADTSAANGSKQDILTEVEISWDYAYMSAPLSTTNESVVYAFGLTPEGGA